jgi:hypothetical protein
VPLFQQSPKSDHQVHVHAAELHDPSMVSMHGMATIDWTLGARALFVPKEVPLNPESGS